MNGWWLRAAGMCAPAALIGRLLAAPPTEYIGECHLWIPVRGAGWGSVRSPVVSRASPRWCRVLPRRRGCCHMVAGTVSASSRRRPARRLIIRGRWRRIALIHRCDSPGYEISFLYRDRPVDVTGDAVRLDWLTGFQQLN